MPQINNCQNSIKMTSSIYDDKTIQSDKNLKKIQDWDVS